MVGGAGHHEQQVGEAIEVHEHDRLHRVAGQGEHGTFGTAADGPRQMQGGAAGGTPRQDEVSQGREPGLQCVDPALEPGDALFVDDDLAHARCDLVRRIGEPRPEREEIALQRGQDVIQLPVSNVRRRETNDRLELVDLTVRRDARVRLPHARPVEQARFALVAGFCVDFHCPDYMNTPAPFERQRFRRHLLTWYRKHGRDLPWRKTDDPYHILVSEIMLQQTQVDRVLPKYDEWLRKYPSLEALAAAPAADVVKTWYPLGYNIRPRRLQSIARESVERFGGQLPSDHDTLISFTGIGRYTAGAIRSFAFRQRAAIVDTNVARVLARVFLGGGNPKQHALHRRIWQLSETLVPRRHCFDYNQALMDFGATVCSARRPRCGSCPMRRYCRAYQRQHSR